MTIRIISKAGMSVLAFVAFLLFYTPVFGSVFDFISNIISGRDFIFAEEKRVSINNMGLPRASANPDPEYGTGGGDITTDDGALVPEGGVSGTIADIEGSRHPSTISVYVVREGDTLSEIGEMFGVSVNTIRWANDIKGDIRPGQTLVILPVSGTRHTIVKGDTLQSIVKKYKADTEEVMQFNGLNENSTLAVGEVLIIPDGEISSVSPASPSRSSNAPSYSGYYMKPVALGRKTQGIHGYNAVDLGAPTGTEVVASASGSVLVARASGWNGGYGNYVVISHSNGTQTLYSHLNSISVFQGQVVSKGESIGTVGATGKATGPHLHFEVRGAKNPF